MKQLIIIFIGGGLGSIIRFLLGKFINTQHNNSFPYGTFIVNIAACFLLGCIVTLASQKQIISPQAKLFWAVGFVVVSAHFPHSAAKASHYFNKAITMQCSPT